MQHLVDDFEMEYARVNMIVAKFGISRSTVYRLIKRGVLDARKVGPQLRLVSVASVRRWLAESPH